MSLSALAVARAKPAESPYKLKDEKGLYLLVTPKGQRYWRIFDCLHDMGNRLGCAAHIRQGVNDDRIWFLIELIAADNPARALDNPVTRLF